MKIIYHCYGGSHSSVTAAAIHLGLLPIDRIPVQKDFEQVPYFDKQVNTDHGHLRFMGTDEFNNDIYIVGRRNAFLNFENTITAMSKLLGFAEDIYLVNCMPYVNWKMVVGGFTSRRLGLVELGRPIVVNGLRFSYLKLAGMVNSVKVRVAAGA